MSATRFPAGNGIDRVIKSTVLDYEKFDAQSGTVSIAIEESRTVRAYYLSGNITVDLPSDGGATGAYDGDELTLVFGDTIAADHTITLSGLIEVTTNPTTLTSGTLLVIHLLFINAVWVECYRNVLSD